MEHHLWSPDELRIKMNNKTSWLTKILTIAGTILTALPVLAPVVFGVIALFAWGQFRFDYMMPAEIAPVAIIGGLMLLWAAIRMCVHRWFVAGSLIAAVVMLVGSQGIAVATGLADGRIEPEGFVLWLVMGMLIVYDLMVLLLAVWGWRLVRQAFWVEKSD